MAKKGARKPKGRNRRSGKTAGAGRRAAARSGAGSARKGARKTGRKTAGARKRGNAARKSTGRRTSVRAGARSATKKTSARRAAPKRRHGAKAGAKGGAKARRKMGGTGLERNLAQTPETGRTVTGRTNPMRTIRSTGTAAGAGGTRRAPGLERERKQLRELEESVPQPPSSLNMDRGASAVRTGRATIRHARHEHTETSPALTGGDVDADWEDAYAVGDESPGGDNPTPDQDRVDDIGRALGVQYQDNEELKAADKIIERDKHRWELDPASAEDYKEHDKEEE